MSLRTSFRSFRFSFIRLPLLSGFFFIILRSEHPDETYAAADLAELAASEPGFTANNTLATIEHGELTVLARRYELPSGAFGFLSFAFPFFPGFSSLYSAPPDAVKPLVRHGRWGCLLQSRKMPGGRRPPGIF